MSAFSIATGTVTATDGDCRVHARRELNRDNTQRNLGLEAF
jgi:hypothetical protein